MFAEDFSRVRRLMFHNSWEDPEQASVFLCHLIDLFLPDSAANDFPAAAETDAATGSALFDFIAYFASALTAERMAPSGAVPPAAESPRPESGFPPVGELRRQPSLLAALEVAAAAVWGIQSRVHGAAAALLRCPLCYAAGVDHAAAARALWALLEFHAAHRVHRETGENVESKESAGAREMIWTHAVAVCRNAVWNGAARTARQCVEEWIFAPGAPHAALFAPAHAESKDNVVNSSDAIGCGDDPSPAVQVASDVRSLRGFILTQCCLLAQDEVASAAEATTRSRGDYNPHIRNNGRSNAEMEVDEDVVSTPSASTIGERGDVELCASLLALRDMAPSLGSAEVFAAVATNAPLHCADGAPLLHWACEAGRAAAVRLMLIAWLDAYGPRGRAKKHRDGDEENEAFAGGEAREENGRDGECSTQYLRVDFSSDLKRCAEGKELVNGVDTRDMSKSKQTSSSFTQAIRCTALHVPVGPHADLALSFALRSGCASIVRLLLLFGATHHISDFPLRDGRASGASEMCAELAALLRNPGAEIDPGSGSGPLHTRLRTALCASAAADTLAAAAGRLWAERARAIRVENASAYGRAHDGVMRLALAALEFDPHCADARATMRDVLSRKVCDQPGSPPYTAAVRRMCAQISGGSCALDKQSHVDKSNVGDDAASPATIATDERQRATFALVNILHGTGGDVRPLWVRLPQDIDVERSLRAAGGLYGTVDGPVPPAAPFERGDLVLFALREHERRFDATRIVRPCDGLVIDVPCVRVNEPGVTRVRLRCAMAPAAVFAFDEDRTAWDPLQWMDTTNSSNTDAVERILSCRTHTMRWEDARRCGQRAMWLREIITGKAPLWGIDDTCEGTVFAAAEFPAPAYANVDDPFGATAEAVFLVRRHSAEAAAVCGAAFRVAGVLPAWGWE